MKKNAQGVYKTKIVLGHDKTGKAVTKWITAHTIKEMDAKKEEVRRLYITGALEAAKDSMATDAIEEYISAKSNTIAEASIDALNVVYRRYIQPALAGKRLCAVRRADLQEILNGFEGKSEAYSRSAVRIFKAVFGMAYSDGLIPIDPSLHLVKPKALTPKTKRALTPEERVRVERAAETNVPLAILYYTGMRVGELRALSWSDIDLNADIIHVTKTCLKSASKFSEGKTKAAKRDIPIVPKLHTVLRRYQGLPHVRVYKLSMQNTEERFKKLFVDLGMDDVTPHHLRHNFVTLCWEKHLDVMITSRIVGHSSPAITMNIYTHLDKQHGKVIKDQVDMLFAEAK